MKHKQIKYVTYILIILAGVILDQLTKQFIAANFELNEVKEIITNLLYITYVRNEGGAWSMLSGNMIFFYIITIGALGAMTYYFFKTSKHEVFTRFGLLLLVSGTLGNFIDRIMFQYVRDFIGTVIFGYYFPIFNVADILITFGVGFIILDIILFEVLKKGDRHD